MHAERERRATMRERWTKWHGTPATLNLQRIQWQPRGQMLGDFTTCTGMSESGVWIVIKLVVQIGVVAGRIPRSIVAQVPDLDGTNPTK